MTTFTQFVQQVEDELGLGESFVVDLIAKLQTDVDIVEGEIKSAVAWVNAHISDVVGLAQQALSDINGAIGLFSAAGIVLPPQVGIAIEALNVGITALNAYKNANASGADTPQALVTGYVAAKQALSAAASAQAAVAVPGPNANVQPAA